MGIRNGLEKAIFIISFKNIKEKGKNAAKQSFAASSLSTL
jgi:hypothetical protein